MTLALVAAAFVAGCVATTAFLLLFAFGQQETDE